MFHCRTKFILMVLTCSWVLPLMSVFVSVYAAPLPFNAPLHEKYLRIESVVEKGFTAQCKQKKNLATCKMSKYSVSVLDGYKFNIKKDIEISSNERRRELSFKFKDPKLQLQQRVLLNPTRWVIEIGYPETLIQSIEDELPFRPYPMPVQTVQIPRPLSAVSQLPGDTNDVKTFNLCWQYWSQAKLIRAYKQCSLLDKMKNVSQEVKNASAKLKAEIVYKHTQRLSSDQAKANSYLGKEVFYISNKLYHTAGEPNPVRYAVTGKASAARLVIKDEDGQEVANDLIAEIRPGRVEEVVWDGIDRSDKKSQLPDGVYTVSLVLTRAPDAERSPSAQVYVKGKVTEPLSVQGIPMLRIDGQKEPVNLSAVIDPESNKMGSEQPKDYFYMKSPDEDPRDKAIELLQKAQQASNRDARERARYILLTSDLKSERSPSEAIEYLREQQKVFPKADSYLLAEEVRLLFKINSYDEAEKVLKEIAKLNIDSNRENIKGSQILALASLAYSKGRYTRAATLYREAYDFYPLILSREAGPLFQAAESFFSEAQYKPAKHCYEEFKERFPDRIPHWIVQIRLEQLEAFDRPLEASSDMNLLSQNLEEPEGRQLARLYSISLANQSTIQMDSSTIQEIFKQVSKDAFTPTAYVLEELWLRQARQALKDGMIDEAFGFSQKIVKTFPNSLLLKHSRLFFQRLLLLKIDKLLREGKYEDLFILFYRDRKQLQERDGQLSLYGFDHSPRSLLYLYAARAARALNLYTIAIKMIERGQTDEKYPEVYGLLVLEMAGTYRDLIQEGDSPDALMREYEIKFRKFVRVIKTKYLNKFDSYDYWASLGFYSELENNPREAKQIYLYALNGPNMTPLERIKLGESIFRVYEQIGDKEKALHALKVLLEIHNEYRDTLNMPVFRAKTLWRRVELCIELNKWPNTVKAIKQYLQESQSLMSSQQTELFRLNGDRQRQQELISYIDLLHERRREALFYHGYALLKIGLVRQAKRQWDLLYKEAQQQQGDPYGMLAEEELRMLTWRENIAPELLKELDAVQ